MIQEEPGEPKKERYVLANAQDLIAVRRRLRQMVIETSLSAEQGLRLIAAVSELGQNILEHAGSGELVLWRSESPVGIVAEAIDQGPGIPNEEEALRPGYSTSEGSGLGLSGVRWIADEFSIRSEPGKGTYVRIAFWK